MRTTVKVICDTGNSWVTDINTDLAGAKAYFIGQSFTREDYAGNETVDTVVQVEQLQAD